VKDLKSCNQDGPLCYSYSISWTPGTPEFVERISQILQVPLFYSANDLHFAIKVEGLIRI